LADLLAGAGIAAAVLRAAFQDGVHHRLLGAGGHAQVDEAGAGHVGGFDQAFGAWRGQQRGDDPGGQLARVHLELPGQLHRDIAGDVAVRGIARALEHNGGNEIGACGQRGEGGLEQGNDFKFLLGEHVLVICQSEKGGGRATGKQYQLYWFGAAGNMLPVTQDRAILLSKCAVLASCQA
jgi:hypothetical protein